MMKGGGGALKNTKSICLYGGRYTRRMSNVFFLKGNRLNDSVLLTKKFNFTRNRHSWNRWIVIHTITVCTVFGKIGFFHRLHVIHTNMLIIFNS